MKSEITSDVYQKRLALFLKGARLKADEFVAKRKKDPTKMKDLITSYMPGAEGTGSEWRKFRKHPLELSKTN